MDTSSHLRTIDGLRTRISAIGAPRQARFTLPFGVADLDACLAGGALAGDALHDVASRSPVLADEAAATLFMAGIAARTKGPVLWAVLKFDLYAPGLEQGGLGPDRTLFHEARDDVGVLAAMEDALRHGGLGAVVGEVRRADMTASRRLQLAASDGGTPAFLFRRWRRREVCPLAENSAAATRWRVGTAPSEELGVPGVGRPRWSVELVRQRNGNPFSMIVEGCDAEGRIALPAAARDRAAAREAAAARAA
jgi:protein ImuA